MDDNRELARSGDVEIAAIADDEIPDLEKRVADFEREVQIALLPPDENEDRDAIVEIRAGTGGSEAAIFAADLYRMICSLSLVNSNRAEMRSNGKVFPRKT